MLPHGQLRASAIQPASMVSATGDLHRLDTTSVKAEAMRHAARCAANDPRGPLSALGDSIVGLRCCGTGRRSGHGLRHDHGDGPGGRGLRLSVNGITAASRRAADASWGRAVMPARCARAGRGIRRVQRDGQAGRWPRRCRRWPWGQDTAQASQVPATDPASVKPAGTGPLTAS